MPMRYTFGGDEHLFVECSDEMSLDAFFNSMSMTSGIRQAGIKGITEICPANASFQIKFDPDIIHPNDILKEVQAIELAAAKAAVPFCDAKPWFARCAALKTAIDAHATKLTAMGNGNTATAVKAEQDYARAVASVSTPQP
ncbi:MAG: carboxyltransferase domain-containing protein, partial [Rhizobium sp.]|nr:carboxyltransferase domain-containing protein [Rhizobium sp.]